MRVFVAAELPSDVAARLAAWAPSHDALRPVAREALHLTLAFLGERSEDEAAAVGELLGGLARPVGTLSLGEALWLPRRRPRVLSVAVEDGSGALGRLQADVAAALAEAVGFAPERRRYLPHVTVARVRSHAQAPSVAPPPVGGEPFAAAALTLFRSRLSPHGARYEALVRVRL